MMTQQEAELERLQQTVDGLLHILKEKNEERLRFIDNMQRYAQCSIDEIAQLKAEIESLQDEVAYWKHKCP